MNRGTSKHPTVGARVEIPAYCDLWMRGSRFGTVARVIEGGSYLDPQDPRGRSLFAVRMDNPQIRGLARVVADDCKFI